MQRLFTTFAGGWPGFGLFTQRLVTSVALLSHGIAALHETTPPVLIFPEIAGSFLGLFLLAGLWTPVAGALVAAVEVWVAFAGGGDVWTLILLSVLGGTLAVIGPGAWSIDARLFGRKHIVS